MKSLAVLIWVFFAQVAFAQTVVVKSGDHPGFTRVVLELPKAAGWQMGRTAEGYNLRVESKDLRFDLTQVFNEIQHNRLAAIWMDPETGDLRLGIACACHALPFEFRPGIIVIDLRDGPPPKGSSFELSLDGSDTAALATRQPQRPRARPKKGRGLTELSVAQPPAYDWLGQSTSGKAEPKLPGPMAPIFLATRDSDLSPLKDALLRQLSRGAAQGLVQMAMPNLATRTTPLPGTIGPRANIHLGEVPGFDVATTAVTEHTMINGGADCIADEKLDVRTWGNDQPVPTQIANSRSKLLGEFDKPDADAVILATKLLIYLGFGAEAQQMLQQMPVDTPDMAIWNGLAKLVDGAPDAKGPFTGMQTCDTAAALWATMAIAQLTLATKPNADAVLRAFSALPTHLRQGLGPDLAAKFLAINEIATARSISHAVQRGLANSQPDIAVMDARIDLAAGDPTSAAAQLEPALAQAGTQTGETLIALVDAKVAAGEEIGPETPVALAALVREQAGSDQEPALLRAQILALASSGDFDQAFALLPKMPGSEGPLWQLLASKGSDTAVLNYAVLPLHAPLPVLRKDSRRQLAGHLVMLGLSDAALVWIGERTENTTDDDRVLAAKAYLSKGAPENGLAWLDGLETKDALELQAEAFWRLGNLDEAANVWAKAGNSDAELRAQSWARNWAALSNSDAPSWKAAAALLTTDPKTDVVNAPGPLALGTALVADSSATRATLAALLASVPRPVPTK